MLFPPRPTAPAQQRHIACLPRTPKPSARLETWNARWKRAPLKRMQMVEPDDGFRNRTATVLDVGPAYGPVGSVPNFSYTVPQAGILRRTNRHWRKMNRPM
jgi:hypothetical protein